MRIISQLASDFRYARDVVGYLRRPLTLAEARAVFEKQLASRSESFLDMLQRGVYQRPSSPYYKLLRHAGIEYEDVRRQVQQDGLEATLEALYDAGVYVTPEEGKGRQAIRRDGLEFPVGQADFDNPLIRTRHFVGGTSGSTGAPSLTQLDLRHIYYRAVEELVATDEHMHDRPIAVWSQGGLYMLVRFSKMGFLPERHFITTKEERTPGGINQKLLGEWTRLVSRFFGRPLPRFELVTKVQAIEIAKWLAEKTACSRPAIMFAQPNPATRICLAAKEHGLDISGTLFSMGGEPYTPGKAAIFASVGASGYIVYAMREAGAFIGVGCHDPIEVDDVHFNADKLALVQRSIEVAPRASVGALFLTTLHPDNPKLMINVDTGDYATVTHRECSCSLGHLGLSTHLHGIRSYEKLTSEGVTFIGSRLYELMDEVLPARFGGAIDDYQLVEEERDDGISGVSIVISPRVGEVDEKVVIATVMENLKSTHFSGGGKLMADQWRQGETLRVVRREPHETRTMKVAPLRVRQTPPNARPASVAAGKPED